MSTAFNDISFIALICTRSIPTLKTSAGSMRKEISLGSLLREIYMQNRLICQKIKSAVFALSK